MALCRHKPTCRVSSHDDLVAALDADEPIASAYSCDRDGCIAAARAWVRNETKREHTVVKPLAR